jgi:hypothetical protein
MQTQLTVKGKEREVDPHASEREAVVLAALDVLNALTFRIRQEDVHRQAYSYSSHSKPNDVCVRIEQLLTTGQPILMTLTEHRNSPRILTSTVEWALLLVSEPSFFRTLLSLASPSQPAQAHGIASRIPLVDRLASLLAFQHSDYSFEATVALHLNVLDVLGALSLAHTDAITLMGESANLIPKMIACISADTTILYESDGQGLAALFPKLWVPPRLILLGRLRDARRIIRRCATCLRLMLLLSSSATFRPKLHAAMPFYNGIMQMFTVAVGRLGASEAPPWLSEERQRDVDGLAGCAQMLLDWVLSPEEVDAVRIAKSSQRSSCVVADLGALRQPRGRRRHARDGRSPHDRRSADQRPRGPADERASDGELNLFCISTSTKSRPPDRLKRLRVDGA